MNLYGLYKQGTVGDNTVAKPGFLSGFEAPAKWDAWEAQKGKAKEEAQSEYVQLVKGHLNE